MKVSSIKVFLSSFFYYSFVFCWRFFGCVACWGLEFEVGYSFVMVFGYPQVMRAAGIEKPYEKLKEFTRGRTITKEAMLSFIDSLDLPADRKVRAVQRAV